MLEVVINQQTIEYQVVYKRIKRIYIRFKNGHYLISAPYLTSKKTIERVLLENNSSLARLKKRRPIKVLDLSENTIINLIGIEYKISYGAKAMIIDRTLYLNKLDLKASFEKVITELLYDYVNKQLIHFYQKMYKDTNYPDVIIKSVKSKLGHYHLAKHQIMIGLSMVYNNSDLIDYVIVHELAHIKEFNHQKSFYDLIAGILPNYKQLEKTLKNQGEVV
jgi:predicted metal-dependent hydrolase